MQEKYGEPFEYVEDVNSDNFTGSAVFNVKCESIPNEVITISSFNIRSDDIKWNDNYISVKYKPQLKNFIQEKANQYFETAKIVGSYSPMVETDADATFDEYLKALQKSPGLQGVGIQLKESSYSSKEQIKNLINSISELGIYFDITINVWKDADYELYNDVSTENFRNKILNNEFVARFEAINNEDGINIQMALPSVKEAYVEQLTDLLQQYSNSVFNEAKVSYYYSSMTDKMVSIDMPDNPTFEEYLRYSTEKTYFTVGVKESEYHSEEQIKELANKIANTGLYFNLTFYVIADDKYNNKELQDCDEYNTEYSFIVNYEGKDINIEKE